MDDVTVVNPDLTMNDFDFLAGTWHIDNRRRKRPLDRCDEWDEFPSTHECVRLFDGGANIEWIDFDTLGFRGLSLRLFDVAKAQWSIYWSSSRDGLLLPPVTGRFVNGEGTFYGDDTLHGRAIRVRFLWSRVTSTTAQWEQAFSADGGETWETNWIMKFSRR